MIIELNIIEYSTISNQKCKFVRDKQCDYGKKLKSLVKLSLLLATGKKVNDKGSK